MTTLEGFEPVTELAADERGRIAFGRVLDRGSERFAVAKNAEGQILLTPVTSIPTRELKVWEDEELRASLLRGLVDADHGRVRARDDFLDDCDAEGEDDQA
ncbi:hypothetical protein [Saccharopolyspora griseoalba]|uniref:Uncharacterized protein n=1 Tax=Saccharopolyspora griseoalba TaxID=1431848 RepID=A0ABW2LRJ3_9PSEU